MIIGRFPLFLFPLSSGQVRLEWVVVVVLEVEGVEEDE